jgi:electron transport complex protein RnfG
MFRFIVVLTLVCMAAALVLGALYGITKPLIEAQAQKQTQEALAKVLPKADDYKKSAVDGVEYYQGYKNGDVVGYAIFSTAKGYAGPIKMLVGINNDSTIAGLEVLSQQETPGLGARCTEIRYGDKEPWFLKQFKAKRPGELKLRGSIDSITGSTITSEAIVKSVKTSVEDFMNRVNNR